MQHALDDLGDDAERVDVAMVTVDPARDTDVLTGYVQSFVADAHAVATDDDADLRRVAESFGVAYEVITAPDGTVEVGHTDYLFGVDDAGRLVISWPFGTSSRRPRGRPRPAARRRGVVRRPAVAALAGLLIAVAGPGVAHADPAQPTDYRHRGRGGDPADGRRRRSTSWAATRSCS